MASKRHTVEEIVAKLGLVDVLVAQGRPVADDDQPDFLQYATDLQSSLMSINTLADALLLIRFLPPNAGR